MVHHPPDSVGQLRQHIGQYEEQQKQLLAQVSGYLSERSQAAGGGLITPNRPVEQQVAVLPLLTEAREYVARVVAAAEDVRKLELKVRPAGDYQDAQQLVSLGLSATDSYAGCSAEVASLRDSSFLLGPGIPQELRAVGQQLSERLQATVDRLHNALSRQISSCLAECSWPPPLVPSQAGAQGGAPQQMFQNADAANMLQRLMLVLTKLQLIAQKSAFDAALQAGRNGSAPASADAPLLWMAQELAAPMAAPLVQLFGPSSPGSPGALDNPDLMLGMLHRLVLDNARRVDFLQGVIQALELHGSYHIGVEFTRAMREAVKQLLRSCKLPEVAAAGIRELWLTWIDALIAFEGSLGRSGLLGCYWDVSDAGELPLLLLKGSTLSVLGEDHTWMDAWLDAEAAAAAQQVEAVLYSEAGWEPGQEQLLAEGCPAWQVDLWPPRAAEEVVGLLESLLARLRFIPQADAQQHYLAGAVGAVLQQAHTRILRMLQQADLFRGITSYVWLPRVCMCICFCHYVEQHLQDMHDDAQVLVTRLLEDQQQEQQLQQQQQGAAGQEAEQADGIDQLAQAAATKLRLLSQPISEFSNCRREWTLKLGKAAAVGFMQHASSYVSGGGHFRASDALPAAASAGTLWTSGVVSGELQPALAWLSGLLEAMSGQLDKDCFRQAWGAAAAAINRDLFNNVACEAIFDDAGALQLMVDLHALIGLFGRYTPRPGCHFKELLDAAKLLNMPQEQADFVRQAVSPVQRANNVADVLSMAGVHHLDADLADTVLSLRMYKGGGGA